MNENKIVAELISQISRQSSRDSIMRLCEELEKLAACTDLDIISSVARYVQQAETRDSYLKLIATIRSLNLPIDAHSLSLALRSASKTANLNDQESHLELVWSGPFKSMSTLRRTEQVLSDMIKEAQHTLLVVSFAVVKVPQVLAAIREALSRNVSIKLIIETEKDSGGRLKSDGLEEFRDSDIGLAEVYIWPESARPKTTSGHKGVLHAKCAVADSKIAFISSANLTDSAMYLNMELGIIVKSETIPLLIEDHFSSLISEGIIRQINL